MFISCWPRPHPPFEFSTGTPEAARWRLTGLQAQRATDPLHVDPDHSGPLPLAAEGGDRESRQVAHLAVGALGERPSDDLPELVEVEVGAGEERTLV